MSLQKIAIELGVQDTDLAFSEARFMNFVERSEAGEILNTVQLVTEISELPICEKAKLFLIHKLTDWLANNPFVLVASDIQRNR